MLAVVAKLMRKGGDDVAALLQQIQGLKIEGRDASLEVDRLRRERALATSYEEARATDDAIERQIWICEHAAGEITQLELQLAAVRASEQAAAIIRHRAIGAQVYRQLRAALVEAGKAQAVALQARADAIKEIGEGQAQLHLSVVAFMGLLTPELLQRYFDQMDRVMAPQPKPKPVAAAPRPKARPMIEISPGAVPARAARQPLHDTAPADDGERLLTILRNGVELVDGRQCAVGGVVRVGSEKAGQLLRSGAAEEAK